MIHLELSIYLLGGGVNMKVLGVNLEHGFRNTCCFSLLVNKCWLETAQKESRGSKVCVSNLSWSIFCLFGG